MTYKEIKKALIDLDKQQVELVEEIRKRYREEITPPELSMIIKGRSGCKARRVMLEVETILNEWSAPNNETK